MSDIKALENYLAAKLLENRITITSGQFNLVVNTFKGRDGWKQYIDRFIKSLSDRHKEIGP